jgi:hypothetical protein
MGGWLNPLWLVAADRPPDGYPQEKRPRLPQPEAEDAAESDPEPEVAKAENLRSVSREAQ